MKPFARLIAAVLLSPLSPGLLQAAPPPAAAPAPAAPATPAAPVNALDLADMLKAGDTAFATNDFETASAKLIQYATNAEKLGITEKLDIIYYVIGISNFQLKKWTPAIEYLKKYEDKYAKGEYLHDVQVLIGKAHALNSDFPASAAQFEKIRNVPELRDQVLPLLAEAYEQADKGAEAVKVLDDYLKGGYNSTDRINAALRLASLYLRVGDVEKGVDVLDKIKNSPSSADFVIIINAKALETAKDLVDNKPDTAILALQAIRRKSEVIRLQTGRNEVLKGKIDEWTRMRKLAPSPAAGARYQNLIEEGKARLKQLEELQVAVEKDEGYDAVVLYHLGRCFDKLHRNWEAELAFRTITTNYKTFPNVSSAMFGQIIALVNLKRTEDALALCKAFLKENPKSTEAPTVAELAVTMSMEKGDFEVARNLSKELLETYPDNASANKLLLYAIGCDFSLYAFKDARARCEEYRKKFPNDPFKEEIDYRYALTYFFENDYKNTLALLGKYVTDYPNGAYKTDARYRLGVVLYGEQQAAKAKNGKDKEYESQFRNVIAEVRDIISKDPNSFVAGELYALLGDCYDQMTPGEVKALTTDPANPFNPTKESGDAFMQGALKAQNQEVLDYCMEQARTKLQAADRWKDIRILHEEFVKTRPDHPDRLKAIYWVCKALSREAKTAEEKAAANEKVKKYLSTEILANINRSNVAGVEMLMDQLTQACIPKRKPRQIQPANADPSKPAPVVAATPDEDPYEVGKKELDKWLGSTSGKLNGTGEARLAYSKIQLLKMLPPKADPADPKKRIDRAPEIEKLMDEFGQNAKPEDLSAPLLAFLGDHLRKRGVIDKAMQCYNRLAQTFPKSDFVDFAYVGLGDLAFEQKDYPQAEKYYTRGKDELPGMKYPNALMGVAKAQFMQGNFKDPEKPLTEIVGTKEWKGELTAEALYWLGKCAFAQKDFAKAVNYYQRIFLSFGKFPDWSIKGYVEAAECFKALGEPDKAKAHLEEGRDYLKKRKLESGPLMQQIKDQAAKLNISLGS